MGQLFHLWNFKTLACTRFIRYGMHQISFWFCQRGITPEREITQSRKKRVVIFPWGTHIWNFKTLACRVHKIWHANFEHTRMHRQPETNMPRQLLRSWGQGNSMDNMAASKGFAIIGISKQFLKHLRILGHLHFCQAMSLPHWSHR